MHEESKSYSGAPTVSNNFLSEFTRKMNLNSKIDSVKEDKEPKFSYFFEKFQIK